MCLLRFKKQHPGFNIQLKCLDQSDRLARQGGNRLPYGEPKKYDECNNPQFKNPT